MSSSDADVVKHILQYCLQVQDTSAEFDNSKDRFDESGARGALCVRLIVVH